MSDSKPIINKIQCKLCGDIIESKHCQDMKWCKCDVCAVDGGKEYLRRVGPASQIIKLSEYEWRYLVSEYV